MKLKKKYKKKLMILIVLVLLVCLGYLIWKNMNTGSNKNTQEAKVVSKIDKYGYKLKDNKTKAYKKMFKELEEILNVEEVDEEQYVKKITEMFVYDFYSLDDKMAKTDIGGVDFVLPDEVADFLKNAQNTYYKYVENNIYGNRNQSLPVVDKVEVTGVEQTPFAYGTSTDEKAYKVTATWSYTSQEFASYQTSATLVFVHDGNKLSLVELQ